MDETTASKLYDILDEELELSEDETILTLRFINRMVKVRDRRNAQAAGAAIAPADSDRGRSEK